VTEAPDVRVVVVSGPICAGKTSLARALQTRFDAEILSARAELLRLSDHSEMSRGALLKLGLEIESSTSGKWIADAVRSAVGETTRPLVVIDAARTMAQLEGIRSLPLRTQCVHLTSSYAVRRARYASPASDTSAESFDAVSAHPTETGADDLRRVAELVIDTSHLALETVASIASQFLVD